MKVELNMASDWKFEKIIEINTLEDILKLNQEYRSALILHFSKGKIESITVYDGYVE